MKCFRHVSGAAQIFQSRTSAIQLCSSAPGRNLFKWYGLIEDECCLLLCCRGALPPTWRQEDFRIRKLIASSEYSRVSKDQLQARVLDDVLQATLDIIPTMADALTTLLELNRAIGDKRDEIIAHLESDMVYILNYVESLRTSRLVAPLIQTVEVGFPWKTIHSTCCPELPFPPFQFVYPPGGIVFICLQAIKLYVQVLLSFKATTYTGPGSPISTCQGSWNTNRKARIRIPIRRTPRSRNVSRLRRHRRPIRRRFNLSPCMFPPTLCSRIRPADRTTAMVLV